MAQKVKKLYRSQDRILGGVCAGLAEYMSWDTSLVRLVVILITFFTGVLTGIIVYVIAWIIIPEEPAEKPKKYMGKAKESNK